MLILVDVMLDRLIFGAECMTQYQPKGTDQIARNGLIDSGRIWIWIESTGYFSTIIPTAKSSDSKTLFFLFVIYAIIPHYVSPIIPTTKGNSRAQNLKTIILSIIYATVCYYFSPIIPTNKANLRVQVQDNFLICNISQFPPILSNQVFSSKIHGQYINLFGKLHRICQYPCLENQWIYMPKSSRI